MAKGNALKYIQRTKPTKKVKRGSKDKKIKTYRGQGR
jgi:hypothetical protein